MAISTRSKIRGCPANALIMALGGCGSDPTFPGYNNHARLDGPTIGAGLVDNDQLRKPLEIEAVDPHEALEVTSAVLVRLSPLEDWVDVIVTVRNVGDLTLCSQFHDLQLYSADVPLTEPILSRVRGAVGVFTNDVFHDCLAPDEQSYLLGHVSSDDQFSAVDPAQPLFDQVDSVRIMSTLETYRVNPLSPSSRVLPIDYELEHWDDEFSILRIELYNEGSEAAVLDAIESYWVLLDDAEDPLGWGFLYPELEVDRHVPVGGESFLVDIPCLHCNRYDGQASKIDVRVGYVDRAG